MKLRPHSPRLQRGTIVQECVMAIVLATAVLAGVARLLSFAAQQRRVGEQRLAARYAAANLMEDAMSRAWPQLTTADLVAAAGRAGSQPLLGSARVRVDVQEENPDLRRIQIEIAWPNTAGVLAQPLRLVAWRHRLEPIPP